MTVKKRRVSYKTRSRLYAAGGVFFILAGIMNYFAKSHNQSNLLMALILVGLGAFYLFIAHVYKTKGEPLEQSKEHNGDS